MASILRILMVEDLLTDAELIKYQIRKSGIKFKDSIVDSREDYVRALEQMSPDIILSDYSLPAFTGMKALQIRNEIAPAIPFILVTGAINEEVAVDVMKAGADDYIIKEHLTRLGPAILQAIEKKEALRFKKAAEDQLKILSRAMDQNPASIVITNFKGDIEYVNPKFTQLTGYTLGEVLGKNPRVLKSGKSSSDDYKVLWETIVSGGEWRGEFENVKKNGESYFERALISPISDEKGEITHFLAVKEDVTEKRKVDEKINLLAQALASVSECVTITDNNNLIVYTNDSFNKTYGYGTDEVLGRHINILIPHDADKDCDGARLEAIIGGNRKGEVMHQRKDGSCFPVLLSISVIRDEQNNPVAQIGVATDITEIIRTREELMEAKVKADETIRLRSSLLNNLSHEIRTPMNAIMGFAGLLPEADAEEKISYASIILKSSGQLLSVIDQVILLSRLQSEKMTINYTGFSPAESVRDIFSMFSLREINEEVTLRLSIPEQYKNLVILSDTNKVRQVLTNLTSNAIKYTLKGTIEIGFEIRNNQVEFYVKDTGIGIPEKEQQKIFETFYRGEQAITSAIGGTGLGLSISKELVGLLGGNIGVTSEAKIGSRFYFTIPLKFFRMESDEKFISNQTHKDIDNSIILIVDDELVNLHYLEILLKNKVKRIDKAVNGKEAVDMALSNMYDLVLMDIKMPVMGGIEATKILKARYPGLKIIAQTAFTLPEEASSVIEAGCDDILCKPVKKEELLAMVHKYV